MERNDLGVATWVKLDRRQAAAITEAILSLIDMAGGPYRDVASQTLVRALMGGVVPKLGIGKREMAKITEAIPKVEATLGGFSPGPDEDFQRAADGAISGVAASLITRLAHVSRVVFYNPDTGRGPNTVTVRMMTKFPPALFMAQRGSGPTVVAAAIVLAKRAGLSWDVRPDNTNPGVGEISVFLRDWLKLPTPKGE